MPSLAMTKHLYIIGYLIIGLLFLKAGLDYIGVTQGRRYIPTINFTVEAPLESPDSYTVSYSCALDDNLNSLHPRMLQKVQKVQEIIGKNWRIMETRRGLCRQADLFKKDKTPRLDSKHLIGLAVDFACYGNEKGKVVWDCSWEKLGEACTRVGLIWGGSFGQKDPGHCEYPPLQPLP